MKILIVYYSLEGSTRLIAEAIAEKIGADVLELKLKKEFKHKGFTKYFWGGKQVFMKEKPELLLLEKNPKDYDLIIIGTPVWAFTYTPALNTFFSENRLENKNIALYCCHEGNPGKTLENMKEKLPNNRIVGKADFLNVASDKEKNIQKAAAWAASIIKNYGSN